MKNSSFIYVTNGLGETAKIRLYWELNLLRSKSSLKQKYPSSSLPDYMLSGEKENQQSDKHFCYRERKPDTGNPDELRQDP